MGLYLREQLEVTPIDFAIVYAFGILITKKKRLTGKSLDEK